MLIKFLSQAWIWPSKHEGEINQLYFVIEFGKQILILCDSFFYDVLKEFLFRKLPIFQLLL